MLKTKFKISDFKGKENEDKYLSLDEVFLLTEKKLDKEMAEFDSDSENTKFSVRVDLGIKQIEEDVLQEFSKIYEEGGFKVEYNTTKKIKPYTGQQYHGNYIPAEYDDIFFITIS